MADASHFIDLTGNVVELDPEHARVAGNLGYISASPKQVEHYELEKKYGSGIEQLKTGAEGAAQALTLGLSTHIEKALGVDPEAIKARQEVNPLSHGIGTAVGVAAPLILTGGAAAPAEAGALGAARVGAELTAPALIARAGQAAGEMLPETAGILGRAARVGVSGAAEGALYGTGNVIHEAALGDPKKVAESALSQIGWSALIGGGLGGALGAAEVAIPKALSSARESLGNLGASAEGLEGAYAKAASKVYGESPEKITEILRARGETFAKPEVIEKTAKDLSNGFKELDSGGDAVLGHYNRTIKPAEMDSFLKEADLTKVQDGTQQFINKIGSKIEEMTKPEDQILFDQAKVRRLEKLKDHLLSLRDEVSPVKFFEAVEDSKRVLYDLSNVAHDADFVPRATAKEIRNLWGDAKTLTENESVFGKAGARQAAANDAQSEFMQARDEIRSGLFQTRGEYDPKKFKTWLKGMDSDLSQNTNDLVDRYVTAHKKLIDVVGDSHEALETGAFNIKNIESLVNKTGDQIQNARKLASLTSSVQAMQGGAGSSLMETVLGGAALGHVVPGAGHILGGIPGALHAVKDFANPTRVAEVLGKLEGLVNTTDRVIDKGAADLIGAAGKRAGRVGSQMTAAEYAEKTEQVREMSNNPGLMQDRLMEATKKITNHAPQTTHAVQTSLSVATAFLASKVPSPTDQGPLGAKTEPTASQIATFNRYYQAVENPLSILEHAKNGMLSKEEIEAVSSVYPQLMQKIQGSILNQVTDHKDEIPYQQRLILSALLGADLDGSMKGLLANQKIGKLSDMGAKPGAGRAGKIKMSDRMATPFSRSMNR